MSRPFVFGVAGYKNTGKTTLIARLIAELSEKGCKVGAIKHDRHGFFAHPKGTDSAQFALSGAKRTIVADDQGHVAMDFMEDEPSQVEHLLSMMKGVDIVIIEGFKTAPIKKWVLIEKDRFDEQVGAYCLPDFSCDKEFHHFVMGWVVQNPPLRVVGSVCPVYHRDDIRGMIDVIVRYT